MLTVTIEVMVHTWKGIIDLELMHTPMTTTVIVVLHIAMVMDITTHIIQEDHILQIGIRHHIMTMIITTDTTITSVINLISF